MGFFYMLLMGVIASVIASFKNRNVVIWFAIGFIINIFGILILLFLPTVRQPRQYGGPFTEPKHSDNQNHHRIWVVCPHCGTNVLVTSSGIWQCPNCQQDFRYDEEDNASHYYDDSSSLPYGVELIVKLFAKMAKADGVVSKREIHKVDEIIKTSLRPSETDLRLIRKTFNLAKKSPETYVTIIRQLYQELYQDINTLAYIVEALLQIARVDGSIHPKQEEILSFAIKQFGLGQGQNQYTAEKEQSLDDCYRILGCSQSDSLQTVKKRYRQLIKENHPDQYMSQQVPKEVIEKANQKIKEIKEAYEKIVASRS
ncbi:DnaJ domain-containing protein [Terrilactibacillus sp. BCM23-1]|uniref:DnaJ domain-containing protein n=1 Tax=Terrilactibacillus tamarindi TaxID=2599694 RepID=A0A6N8CLX4_9BACI|nr:TerB family tellurite resistance protein [Terrilactibacillus tamarindi]MTT30841.1 DnaJ domain-containing protein [Terrilactibacillus tamarindi]